MPIYEVFTGIFDKEGTHVVHRVVADVVEVKTTKGAQPELIFRVASQDGTSEVVACYLGAQGYRVMQEAGQYATPVKR